MIIKGMAAKSKKGEWPKICKLGSHDLTSEGFVVVKNYKYGSAFRDLSGEIVKCQL